MFIRLFGDLIKNEEKIILEYTGRILYVKA